MHYIRLRETIRRTISLYKNDNFCSVGFMFNRTFLVKRVLGELYKVGSLKIEHRWSFKVVLDISEKQAKNNNDKPREELSSGTIPVTCNEAMFLNCLTVF
jgi:hypothetical protein